MNNWFAVDKEGLAKLLERRGKSFAVLELIQNAWDTEATEVDITLRQEGRFVRLIVEDNDPTGFVSLVHAWTLFAESIKKSDATKRGRFDLGEKLVLAISEEATIRTTTGTVVFRSDGTRSETDESRKVGSEVDMLLRMDESDLQEAIQVIATLLPPTDRVTRLNGEPLEDRKELKTFRKSLPTEIAGKDGILKRTTRVGSVRIFEPAPGEKPSLYEMGIPVVELDGGEPWHFDVGQKIPLNFDRDNVPPSFLRALRVAVLNAAHILVSTDNASSSWVREAAADKAIKEKTFHDVMNKRFGRKRVVADPSDKEGTLDAAGKGYNVLHGGSLSKGEWENNRRFNDTLPAGQVTPSPDPSEGRDEAKEVDPANWTNGMVEVARYASLIGEVVTQRRDIPIIVVDDPSWGFAATYGPSSPLTLNKASLGREWFDVSRLDPINELLIHEFTHHRVSNHLSHEFHDECCRIGAVIVGWALAHPDRMPSRRSLSNVVPIDAVKRSCTNCGHKGSVEDFGTRRRKVKGVMKDVAQPRCRPCRNSKKVAAKRRAKADGARS